mmetsp:Transcript_6014/g.9258  ORF Transcript_6014/g.9258 Transcript_6014/m.9258 type:complete len:148 (+) Transcript_6014:77-520(+)
MRTTRFRRDSSRKDQRLQICTLTIKRLETFSGNFTKRRAFSLEGSDHTITINTNTNNNINTNFTNNNNININYTNNVNNIKINMKKEQNNPKPDKGTGKGTRDGTGEGTGNGRSNGVQSMKRSRALVKDASMSIARCYAIWNVTNHG